MKFGFGLRRWSSDPRLYSSEAVPEPTAEPPQGVPRLPPGSAQQVMTWMHSSSSATMADGSSDSGAGVDAATSSLPGNVDQTGNAPAPTKANLFGVDFFQEMPTAEQLIEVKQKKKVKHQSLCKWCPGIAECALLSSC